MSTNYDERLKQSQCTHKWVKDGESSSHRPQFYRCSKCRKEQETPLPRKGHG